MNSWIKPKLVSGVASLLFKLRGGQTVKGCRKEWQQHQAEQVSHPDDPQLEPQAARVPASAQRGEEWQYVPWSLLSVGESSCRRKNFTSCFRGPHFCRCSYIMCSKGIARSKETAVWKTGKKKQLFLRTRVTATSLKHFNLYQAHHH